MAFDKVIDSAELDGAITATANAIREKAESAEKIEWNRKTGFAEAVRAITVDPTKVTILREQTFAGFVVDPTFGAYSPGYVMPALFQLENGKTYYVNWDGIEYECVAYSYSYGDSTIVAVGNGGSLGLPSNNEPFLISYNATYDNSQLFSTEAKDSHAVWIWQKAAGGSSDDVRYVTFMSEDGTVELGKKAVATGDDCADPIARGVFSTPTKESTAQYTYTFYGWATTPNGAADSNWNKAVTEDRTVYANFASVVRYYTITYYDSDGTTVLKTESLAYGTTPSYKPSKENTVFSTWNPSPSPVTGNTIYTAVWEEKIAFETASWAKIVELCDAGRADEYFSVGETKQLTLTNGKTFTVEIVGMNHDILSSDTTKKASLSIVVKDGPLYTDEITPGKGVNWSNEGVRTTVRNIINNFPTELKSAVKTVKKKVMLGAASGDYSSVTYSETLWLLSKGELFGETSYCTDGPAYTYFTGGTNTANGAKRIRYNNGTAVQYPMRTTQSAWNQYWGTVSNTGYEGTSVQGKKFTGYLVFGFCI